MNSVISDTAEYGCYLYDQACKPLLGDFMSQIDVDGESRRAAASVRASGRSCPGSLLPTAANTAATSYARFNRPSPHITAPPLRYSDR